MIGSVATPHEYQDSPFSPGITFTIPTCSLQSLMCLGTHSILQHIIMYISTHLYIYPQCPLMYIQMLHPYTIHHRNCMCEVMQLFMAFKLLYIFRSVNTTRYTYSHNSHR